MEDIVKYKLWLHPEHKLDDWSSDSFDIYDIDDKKKDIINYKTSFIMMENLLYYINSSSYSKNYHITLTNYNDFPVQERYNKCSYYSFTNKFDRYSFWEIIVYGFVTKSNMFKHIDKIYGVSYSCKHGNFIVKILYNINENIGEIFNVNSDDYKTHIKNSDYNLKYKYRHIK